MAAQTNDRAAPQGAGDRIRLIRPESRLSENRLIFFRCKRTGQDGTERHTGGPRGPGAGCAAGCGAGGAAGVGRVHGRQAPCAVARGVGGSSGGGRGRGVELRILTVQLLVSIEQAEVGGSQFHRSSTEETCLLQQLLREGIGQGDFLQTNEVTLGNTGRRVVVSIIGSRQRVRTDAVTNLSILKEINPRCSLEGLMLKLKLQYFAHSCEVLTH